MNNATLASALCALLLPFALAVGAQPVNLPGQSSAGQLPGAPPKPAIVAPPSAGAALPYSPCCSITAINKATGIVTAREKSGNRTIEIKATPAQVQNLRVGQDIFANLDTKKASLDGKTLCCDLALAAPAPGHVATAQTPTPTAPPASPPALSLLTKAPTAPPAVTSAPLGAAPVSPAAMPAKAPLGPCCSITKIDKALGLVTAKDNTAARINITKSREPTFEFHVADAKQLQELRVGQSVFANLESGEVSLDGKTMCCKIKASDLRAAAVAPRGAPTPTVLPTASAGAVQMVKGSGAAVSRPAAGSAGMLYLSGIDAIKAAPGLHQAAKDFLVMHARTLPEHELDTYVVDANAAEAWFKAHPVPASVAKAAADTGKKKKKKGCNISHMSTHCASNEISNAADDLTNVWRKAWSDTTAEAMRDWNMAKDCFSDQTLKPIDVPVKFKETVQLPLPSMTLATVTLGVPVDVDVTAHVKLFYIPCLPFAVRPKTMGADGTMESGGSITAAVNMTAPVKHKFPVAHADVTMATVPLLVGPVPVGIMTVSIYVDGNVEFDAKGKLNGKVKLESLQMVAFDFECSGHGCNMSSKKIPIPATAMESVKLDGRLTITPAIYTALELSFNGPVFQVRAGPETALVGELYGCGAASGMQNTAGVQTGAQSYALTGDVDWGLDLYAEALGGTQKLTDKHIQIVKNPQHLHLWDLAQSTGLIPVVSGSTQLTSGKPTAYMIKMPECYPFRNSPGNTLQYRVSWTGKATATAAAPTSGAGCTFQAEEGTCHGAPAQETAFNLSWAAAGDYTVTVAPISDPHGHKFEESRARQVNIRVQ